MEHHGRRRRWVILAGYAAYLITPMVHTALESPGCPRGCQRDDHDEIVITAPFQAPCTDPTHHHHHHGHSPDDCFFCQTYPTPFIPRDLPLPIDAAEEQEPLFGPAVVPLTNTSAPRPHLIRGPPHSIAC